MPNLQFCITHRLEQWGGVRKADLEKAPAL